MSCTIEPVDHSEVGVTMESRKREKRHTEKERMGDGFVDPPRRGHAALQSRSEQHVHA
jgi:hypothetical protein